MKSLSMLGRSLFALAVLLCLLLPAHAQYRAGVQGTVTDPSGAAVEGATVTVTSLETNISKQATTDANGVYVVSGLAPGLYRVTIEKQGFKKKALEEFKVAAEQMNSADVPLEVGDVAQSVTVNASDLPALNTENANIAGTLTSKEIQALPSFGRDPYQLLRLAPGVFGDGASGVGGGGVTLPGSNQASSSSTGSIFETENQPQIVANGTRNNGNSYQIDGIEVNSLAWGGSAVITPNEESVKEVQIQSNPYSAENGRNSGAQLLVVSQNGTNQFHGSAFLKIHRPGLNAYQQWGGPSGGQQRDANRFNQFGGSFGGPIWKNKIFYFFSYETLRNNTVGSASQWLETPQFLSKVAAAAPNSIAAQYATFPKIGAAYTTINQAGTCENNGLSATQCRDIYDSTGHLLGLDIGSPRTGAALGTLDPTFGQAATPYGVGGGLDGIPDIFNVNTIQPTDQVATQYNGRMDVQVTKKDLVTFSVYWVPNDTSSFNGPARETNVWHSNRLNYSGALLWDHTFTPSLLNEARVNVTRWYYNEANSNPQEPFGFPADRLLNDKIGPIAMGCCPLFGPPGPGVFNQTTYNFRDTVTKIINSHSLKLGVDIYKEQDNDVATWAGLPPTYTFNDLWDWANDAPISESASFDPRSGRPTSVYKAIRSGIYAFFLQDDWKVKPNFTLNMGLRWEYFGPVHEKHGNFSTVFLGTGSNALNDINVLTGGDLSRNSWNNWGPQLGFAWSPKGVLGHEFNNKLVLRGGGGFAYNRMQEAITLNGRFNPPLQSSLTLYGSNISYALSDSTSDLYGFPSNPAAIQTFGSNGLPTCAPATCASVNLTAFDYHMPTPVVYRYSMQAQYDLGHSWIASLGYTGSQSRHFTRQINNLNWLYPNNQNAAVNSVDLYTNDANGHYNALLAEVQHQFSRSFTADAQYTFSSCWDHGSSDYYSDSYPFNISGAYGQCDYDVRHAFKAYGVWSPNFFHGNNWKSKTLGGWELSGIYTYHTGFPWTPVYNVSVQNGGNTCSLLYTNSGFCTAEVAAYAGGAGSNFSNSAFEASYGNFPQLANASLTTGANAYFSVPTFSANGTPSFPGIHRNYFRGPHYHDIDLTLRKDFGLPNMKFFGENAKISLRGDFYNLFNTLNLQPLGSTQQIGTLFVSPTTYQVTGFSGANTTFGQAQAALGARVIEFQFRFSF